MRCWYLVWVIVDDQEETRQGGRLSGFGCGWWGWCEFGDDEAGDDADNDAAASCDDDNGDAPKAAGWWGSVDEDLADTPQSRLLPFRCHDEESRQKTSVSGFLSGWWWLWWWCDSPADGDGDDDHADDDAEYDDDDAHDTTAEDDLQAASWWSLVFDCYLINDDAEDSRQTTSMSGFLCGWWC